MSGAERDMVSVLLDQPGTAQGIEQNVAFLVRARRRKMLLGIEHPRFGAIIRLGQLCFAGRCAFPDALRGHIHVISQHFPIPLFLFLV